MKKYPASKVMGSGTKYPGIGQVAQSMVRQAEVLNENRIVLYKRGKSIGLGYYVIEISSSNTHLFIAAYDHDFFRLLKVVGLSFVVMYQLHLL